MKIGNENYLPAQSRHVDRGPDGDPLRHHPETARIFEPDIFLVDKEPLGLRGEVESTLLLLRDMGKQLVLGLRDVMDDPGRLAEEWDRKRALPAVEELYDHIWIYGLPEICDPLEGIGVVRARPAEDRASPAICGARATPSGVYPPPARESEEPYVLVTTGGGGDGAMLVDWVLRAYEFDPTLDIGEDRARPVHGDDPADRLHGAGGAAQAASRRSPSRRTSSR